MNDTDVSSSLRVNYELRPAKQVERRMLIDALQNLALAGFQICDYQYTGLGAIYFVDFILFHRLLGIDNMLSLEKQESLESRVRFNKPFSFIRYEMKKAADVIPSLSVDRKHLLWLDYDAILWREPMVDLFNAASRLPSGSIVLCTLDVTPPEGRTPGEWRMYFEEQAGEYLGPFPSDTDFVGSNLVRINQHLIFSAIKAGLQGRSEIHFAPLFNFLYKDGASPMLSAGGMIATDADQRRIEGSRLRDCCRYIRFREEDQPCEIRIPKLTRKERLYLDAAMPCAPNWTPADFALEPQTIKDYREIYRFFPAYAEMLL